MLSTVRRVSFAEPIRQEHLDQLPKELTPRVAEHLFSTGIDQDHPAI
jgi:hypothetical protein